MAQGQNNAQKKDLVDLPLITSRLRELGNFMPKLCHIHNLCGQLMPIFTPEQAFFLAWLRLVFRLGVQQGFSMYKKAA